MSESGQSWQRHFEADGAQARHARAWVATCVLHPDAPLLTTELFIAVLGTRPDKIQITVSTAGPRTRITASGPALLPLRALRGAGLWIIRGLALGHGIAPDGRGLWAEVIEEQA